MGIYLEGWLTGLKINNFEDLKEFLIVGQIKKSASSEIRYHFLNEWTNGRWDKE